MKVRKKPIVVEAIHFDGTNHYEVLKFIYPSLSEEALEGNAIIKPPIVIETLEGEMRADNGDWIIRGVEGEIYPVKPNIFEKTYDILEE